MADQAHIIILLGPPASGKGTQAERLEEKMGLPHIASGDLFREHIARETELGLRAKKYIDQGDLVPDQLTINMIEDRLAEPDAEEGAILDGFPRTMTQAEALDDILEDRDLVLAEVVYISVPEEVLVERVSGRRVCPVCGRTYHIQYYPPEEEGVCDVDQAQLYQREDDRPETVRQRLEVYQAQTSPLIDYYREQGVLVEIAGDQPIDRVTEDILDTLGDLQG